MVALQLTTLSTTSRRLLMGTSIQSSPMRRINGGLRYKESDYIMKGTPHKKGMNIFQEKRNKCENRKLPSKEISTLFINTKSILGPAQGRVHTKLLFYSLLSITLVPLVLDL